MDGDVQYMGFKHQRRRLAAFDFLPSEADLFSTTKFNDLKHMERSSFSETSRMGFLKVLLFSCVTGLMYFLPQPLY